MGEDWTGDLDGAMSGVVDGLLAAAEGGALADDAVEVDVRGLMLALDKAPSALVSPADKLDTPPSICTCRAFRAQHQVSR